MERWNLIFYTLEAKFSSDRFPMQDLQGRSKVIGQRPWGFSSKPSQKVFFFFSPHSSSLCLSKSSSIRISAFLCLASWVLRMSWGRLTEPQPWILATVDPSGKPTKRWESWPYKANSYFHLQTHSCNSAPTFPCISEPGSGYQDSQIQRELGEPLWRQKERHLQKSNVSLNVIFENLMFVLQVLRQVSFHVGLMETLANTSWPLPLAGGEGTGFFLIN